MTSQYVSVGELLDAELGSSFRNLPAANISGPNAPSAAQNYVELTGVIQRASAMADRYCRQVLGATVDSEEAIQGQHFGSHAGVDRNGYLWYMTNYFPIISVTKFQYGFPAIGGTSWTAPALTDLVIPATSRPNRIIYPAWFDSRPTVPLRVQVTYVNGYPNTFLASSAALGATNLLVRDTTGIMPNATLTLYDRASTEDVQVASTFTPTTGEASVPLASGTLHSHTVVPLPGSSAAPPYDVRVSSLPADLRQAIFMICKMLVDVRGQTSLTMSQLGQPAGIANGGKPEELPSESQYILDFYRRTI